MIVQKILDNKIYNWEWKMESDRITNLPNLINIKLSSLKTSALVN